MKKLVFLFVAFAAVSLASCGNKAANSEEAADTTAVEVVEEAAEITVDSVPAADTVVTDSVVEAVVAE
jgi:ABC-type enterochelin transport system substrate-binding protein